MPIKLNTASGGGVTLQGADTATDVTVTVPASDGATTLLVDSNNRIKGDFSNSTIANRVTFQTSTADSTSSVGVIPSGSGVASALNVFSSSDPDNASYGQIRVGTDLGTFRVISDKLGTGTYLPITFQTGGNERMRVGTDGVITSGLGGMQVISGTAVAASGTAVNFTGIPSWAKRITVMLSGVSTNGTSDLLIQIGDSGGIENTGYTGTYHGLAVSSLTGATLPGSGIQFNDNAASGDTRGGVIVIAKLDGNTWSFNGGLARQNGGTRNAVTNGSKTLSGVLDSVRVTTAGGVNTFSSGTINILYE